MGWVKGHKESGAKSFVSLASVGVKMLAFGAWLSGFQNSWRWVAPWFCALIVGRAGRKLYGYYKRGATAFVFALAILCFTVGVGEPCLAVHSWSLAVDLPQPAFYTSSFRLSQRDVTAAQANQALRTDTAIAQTALPQVFVATSLTLRSKPMVFAEARQPATSQLGFNAWAVWNFLLTTGKSIWGIFHLTFLFIVGHFWLRRWGGWITFVAILVAAGVMGGTTPAAFETLKHIFSSSPVEWMHLAVSWSITQFGTAGWAILASGASLVILFFPAQRAAMRMLGPFHLLTKIKQDFGSTIAGVFEKELFQDEDFAPRGVKGTLTILFVWGLSGGIAIALWIVLRAIANLPDYPAGDLAFLFIPDLSVPSWKPVLHWSYFALALAIWMFYSLQLSLQKRAGMAVGTAGCNPVAALFVGLMINALLVPGGVMLFALGQSFANLTLSIPLFFVETARKRREKEDRRIQEEEEWFRQKEREQRKRKEEEQCKRKEELASRLLYVSPIPLTGTLIQGMDRLWLLSEDGRLTLLAGQQARSPLRLPLQSAIGIAELGEQEALALGDQNRAVRIQLADTPTVSGELTLSIPVQAFALNPYKTMLAWVSVAAQTVNVLVLKTGQEFTLISGLNLSPALAFSTDGRYLAAGGADGFIHVLDFATRRVIEVLTLPENSPSWGQAVCSLFSCKDGGWLSIYADRRIVLWNIELKIGKQIRPQRRIMALDFHMETGRLALGLRDGILQVFDAGLNKIFDKTVQEKDITYACFSQDGRSVFTVGNKTEVWRVDL